MYPDDGVASRVEIRGCGQPSPLLQTKIPPSLFPYSFNSLPPSRSTSFLIYINGMSPVLNHGSATSAQTGKRTKPNIRNATGGSRSVSHYILSTNRSTDVGRYIYPLQWIHLFSLTNYFPAARKHMLSHWKHTLSQIHTLAVFTPQASGQLSHLSSAPSISAPTRLPC
jgi:hypothetical protein